MHTKGFVLELGEARRVGWNPRSWGGTLGVESNPRRRCRTDGRADGRPGLISKEAKTNKQSKEAKQRSNAMQSKTFYKEIVFVLDHGGSGCVQMDSP